MRQVRNIPEKQRGGLGYRQQFKPLRCKAKHDVPWSERCLLAPNHQGDHVDKAGRKWA